MKKRIFTVFLSLVMILTMIPATAVKAEDQAAESIKVLTTISDKGNIVVAQETVTVTDINKSGTFDVDDVLYCAHEAFYKGGAEAGYSSYTGDYGLSLGTLWGDTSGSFGYYVDHASAWSLADVVKEGSYVNAFVYKDQTSWSDQYAFFNATNASTKVGKGIEVVLNASGYDENWNTVVAPFEGATIAAVAKDGTLTPLNVVTDKEGKATVKFSKSGTYYITATSDQATLVPAVEKIVVKKYAQSLKLSLKGKTVKVAGKKTKVSFKKVSGSKKLSINKSTGKIKVKKGTKKGTYKIKVKVSAKSSTKYASATKTKTFKVKVK